MCKYLRTFSGCNVGEERLQLSNLDNTSNRIMTTLVNKGYLQITKQNYKYRWFALTDKGKLEVIKKYEK